MSFLVQSAERTGAIERLIDRVLMSIDRQGFYTPLSSAERQQLIEFGFSTDRRGIVVPATYERLDAASIQAQFSKSTLNGSVQVKVAPCVGSTNSELQSLAKQQSIHRQVILAEMQVHGRGRYGRRWYSPFGQNIALSMGVELTGDVHDASPLSLVVAIAVARALESVGSKDISLKWPNDILLNQKKVGGILVELLSLANTWSAVIGIGLNYGTEERLQKQMLNDVGDLRTYLDQTFRNQLCARLIECVYTDCEHFSTFGFGPFIERWNTLDSLKGKRVEVQSGEAKLSGIAKGIRDDGALLVCDGTQMTHALIAGEVTIGGFG